MIRVLGLPAPQGSKRHVGGGRMVESSAKVEPWREAVVCEVKRAGYVNLAIDLPVSLRIDFYLPRPQSHYKASGEVKASAPQWPKRTPDLDKLLRSTFDALTQSRVVADDARIVSVAASKQYATREEPPGAMIHVTALWESA